MSKSPRRTKAEWLELIELQKHSGLSVRAFCQERGLPETYFSTLRSRLRADDTRTPDFVQARVLKPESPSIQLRKADVMIGIPGGCDPAWVAQLVKALCA